MTLMKCEQWLWRLALLMLPLGTVWIFSFGIIGGIPWAMGNVGIGIGEFFVILASICAALRGGVTFPKHTMFLAFAWLGLLFGRGLATSFPMVSTLCVLRYAIAVLLFVITIPLTPSELRKWWGIGMIVPCLLGLLEVFVWHGVPASTLLGVASHPLLSPGTSVIEVAGQRFMRAYGLFPHPNIFGVYLVMSILVLMQKFEIRISKFENALLALAGFCLALTFSRAALLALFVYCFVVMLSKAKQYGVRDPSLLLRMTTGLRMTTPMAGLMLGVLLFLPAYGVRIGTRSGRLEVKSTDQRVESLRDGWKLFVSQPLVGVGALQSVPMLITAHPDSSPWEFEPAHAVPMLMLAEWGVLGAAFFVALFFFLLAPLAPPLHILAPLLILALFDHALLTSSQLVMLVPLAIQISRHRYDEP